LPPRWDLSERATRGSERSLQEPGFFIGGKMGFI
jgi:hypothetical protein